MNFRSFWMLVEKVEIFEFNVFMFCVQNFVWYMYLICFQIYLKNTWFWKKHPRLHCEKKSTRVVDFGIKVPSVGFQIRDYSSSRLDKIRESKSSFYIILYYQFLVLIYEKISLPCYIVTRLLRSFEDVFWWHFWGLTYCYSM